MGFRFSKRIKVSAAATKAGDLKTGLLLDRLLRRFRSDEISPRELEFALLDQAASGLAPGKGQIAWHEMTKQSASDEAVLLRPAYTANAVTTQSGLNGVMGLKIEVEL